MNRVLIAALAATLGITSLGFAPGARAQPAVQETRSVPGDPVYERDRRSERREGRRAERAEDRRHDGVLDPRPAPRHDPRDDPRHNPGQNRGQNRGYDPGYDHPGYHPGYDARETRREQRAYERWQRAENRYDAGEYRRPRGYVDRQWGYGQTLPPGYRSRGYIVSDYPRYGLQPPPWGHQYTRVGNDVLLTVIATGVIAAVIVGIFN